MPISVCRQQNGATHIKVVTKIGHLNHKNQIDSFYASTHNNPFHLLDEENAKPLHKLLLSNGNIVYSTHKSITDLIKALTNDHHTILAPKNNLNFQNLGKVHSKTSPKSTNTKQESTNNKKNSHHYSPKQR